MTLEAEKPDVAVSNGIDGGGDDGCKAPRLPRWTRHEILVLIEGKRVAESRIGVARGRTGSNQVEPKWVSISSYCKRHGVNREPVQCRKRWGNLAGDYRKIKEWDSQIKEEADSFWIMRNDLRREKKLPGFFDREIYDVLDRGAVTVTGTELVPVKMEDKDVGVGVSLEDEEEEEAVFDSGRTAGADYGLFSDFEQSKEEEEMGETPTTECPKTSVAAPTPISERRCQPFYKSFFDQGRMNMKHAAAAAAAAASYPEKGSPSRREGEKRRRVSSSDGLHEQLVKVLESNNKMLAAQLEAQNVNSSLDRDQRKDQGDCLIAVLNKLADALGKVADKI